MMLGVMDENTVFILDKAENNTATIKGRPIWGSFYTLNDNAVTATQVETNTFCASVPLSATVLGLSPVETSRWLRWSCSGTKPQPICRLRWYQSHPNFGARYTKVARFTKYFAHTSQHADLGSMVSRYRGARRW